MFSKVLFVAVFAVVLLALNAESTDAPTTSTPGVSDSFTVVPVNNKTVTSTTSTSTEKSANGINAIFAILPVFLKMVL